MLITPKEAMSIGIWEKICRLTGISLWAVNEGMDENIQLNVEVKE